MPNATSIRYRCLNPDCEHEFDIKFYFGSPGTSYGPPDRCEPPYGPECDPDCCPECATGVNLEMAEQAAVDATQEDDYPRGN